MKLTITFCRLLVKAFGFCRTKLKRPKLIFLFLNLTPQLPQLLRVIPVPPVPDFAPQLLQFLRVMSRGALWRLPTPSCLAARSPGANRNRRPLRRDNGVGSPRSYPYIGGPGASRDQKPRCGLPVPNWSLQKSRRTADVFPIG